MRPSAEASPVAMHVPALFGHIFSAELRGAYVLVMTEGGRVSFHAESPRRVSDLSWRTEHNLAGKMHWHSITKALRTHCIVPDLVDRVSFQITHSRYSSGARSSMGAGGAVIIDTRKVLQCSPNGYQAFELGAALAEYLYLAPEDALTSGNVVIAALALLDRRLPIQVIKTFDRNRFQDPIWLASYDLRLSQAA